MPKIRGFRLNHKFVKIFKWVVRNPNRRTYQCLNRSPCAFNLAMSKLCNWIKSLKRGAKELCFYNPGSGYSRLDQYPVVSVPKGHLAIYVGEKEDDAHRVLVPLIYFNHPLFVGLLRESEKIYGFDYPGGIQIPCRISEFENVQTKITAARCGDSGGGNWHIRRSWKRRYL